MSKIYFIIISSLFVCVFCKQATAQTLPVGTAGLEDYYRRKQLLGELDSTLSFSVRPLSRASLKVENVFDPDSSLAKNGYFKNSGPVRFFKGIGEFQILPFTWQQQYNSHHPYGWNDGAMISSRGYQTLISGGIYLKMGFLSIQFRPEMVYAENKSFDGFAKDRDDLEFARYYQAYNNLDVPERFGMESYSKMSWGQSNIRLTFGPASIGLSNENLWWGPGRRNSLIMTNNASGFKHFTLNTTRPIKTFLGTFEGQIIAGKLDNSGLPPLMRTTNSVGSDLFSRPNSDWRYLSAFNINFQPKWIPGLFIGYIRNFVSYQEDIKEFKDYFPFFTPVQKSITGPEGDPYYRDQRLSMYARWLFPKAHAEIYFEYGINDNSFNFRDFIGSPDHSRAYIFGISKLIPLKRNKDEFLEVNIEVNQMSQSVDRMVRPAGGFYQHFQVRQGYTHSGQVLGAGIGSGGNLQSFELSWVKGLKKLGFSFERYEHDADFYNASIYDLNNKSRRWVDFALAAQGQWDYKNLIFTAKLQGIRSLNYQWRMKDYTPGEYYIPHNDVFNFHGQLGASFRF